MATSIATGKILVNIFCVQRHLYFLFVWVALFRWTGHSTSSMPSQSVPGQVQLQQPRFQDACDGEASSLHLQQQADARRTLLRFPRILRL